MDNKHTIFGFVGASGSGKSTIMIELLNFFPHLQIIKSTSTRPKRDETDELFYKFVDPSFIDSPAKDNFLSHEIFVDNHYVYEKGILDAVLRTNCGMFAILEHTVPIIRDHGYDVKLIKIIADRDWELERTRARQLADLQRDGSHNLEFDLIVQNSFKPDGLEQSVRQIAEFIHQKISSHMVDRPTDV